MTGDPRRILQDVFGFAEFRGVQERVVKRVMAGEKIDRGPEDRRPAVPVGVSSIPKTGRSGGLGGAPAPQGA